MEKKINLIIYPRRRNVKYCNTSIEKSLHEQLIVHVSVKSFVVNFKLEKKCICLISQYKKNMNLVYYLICIYIIFVY